MKEYRAKRLAEMQQDLRVGHATMRQFGRLVRIKSSQAYLQEVDAPQNHNVRILLLIAAADVLSHALTQDVHELANKYQHAKFLVADAAQVFPEFDAIALPTVLVY